MFKVEVIADNSGIWVSNRLTFTTEVEADEYARNLVGRWMAVREFRIVECNPENNKVN